MGSSPQPSEKSHKSDFPVIITSPTFKSIQVAKQQKILHRDESQEGNL
jgi:hypothetical protein